MTFRPRSSDNFPNQHCQQPDGKQCFDLFGQYICVNDHALHPRSCEGRCRNGGTCIGEGFEARCECPDHTSGEFCEQKVTISFRLSVQHIRSNRCRMLL